MKKRHTDEQIIRILREAESHEEAFATRVDQTLKWHLNRRERTFC